MSTFLPLKLFVVYAREDHPALLELKSHLRPLETRRDIVLWYDEKILPGEKWDDAIKAELEAADIVLLFISKSFFNSEYIEKEELKTALRRHNKGETTVIPVIVRPYLWNEHPEISVLQALPRDGKPVSSWRDEDEAWLDVAKSLGELVKTYRDSPKNQDLSSNTVQKTKLVDNPPNDLSNPEYKRIARDKKSGGVVFRHIAHTRDAESLISEHLVQFGKKIWLMPSKENGTSNVLMDEKEWRFQNIEGQNLKRRIQTAIRFGKAYSSNILCFVDGSYKVQDVTFGIYNAIKFDQARKVVRVAVFFSKSNLLIELEREEILNNDFKKFFKKTEEAA